MNITNVVGTRSNFMKIASLDFMSCVSRSRFVLTDSGGIQEETTYLSIPCLTMRENTERPVTVTHGTNIIVGLDTVIIFSHIERVLQGRARKKKPLDLWDGRAAERICSILSKTA